jgi:CII-binding regulator of phage lambda lysogenization HflD
MKNFNKLISKLTNKKKLVKEKEKENNEYRTVIVMIDTKKKKYIMKKIDELRKKIEMVEKDIDTFNESLYYSTCDTDDVYLEYIQSIKNRLIGEIEKYLEELTILVKLEK